MAKADRPLQVFRGTTLDAVNSILKTNAERLAALSPTKTMNGTLYDFNTRFGPGHYFTNDPVSAYYYGQGGREDLRERGVVLHGHLEDKNPLLIPNADRFPIIDSTGGPIRGFYPHPDPELRDRAVQAYKDLRPHLEQRLRDNIAQRDPSTYRDPETAKILGQRDLDEGLQKLKNRQRYLDEGDPTEIARMGKHMGYNSALIYRGAPDPEDTDEPRVHTAAYLVAYNPSAVKLSGAVRLNTTNSASDLLKHFSAGNEAGRA